MVVLEPFAGGPPSTSGRDGFTERGGAAALTDRAGRGYDDPTVRPAAGRDGLRPGSPISLKALLGYRHAFGDVAPAALLAFASGGARPSRSPACRSTATHSWSTSASITASARPSPWA